MPLGVSLKTMKVFHPMTGIKLIQEWCGYPSTAGLLPQIWFWCQDRTQHTPHEGVKRCVTHIMRLMRVSRAAPIRGWTWLESTGKKNGSGIWQWLWAVPGWGSYVQTGTCMVWTSYWCQRKRHESFVISLLSCGQKRKICQGPNMKQHSQMPWLGKFKVAASVYVIDLPYVFLRASSRQTHKIGGTYPQSLFASPFNFPDLSSLCSFHCLASVLWFNNPTICSHLH